ncbi:monocarboxylate transporter 14-like isoform X1 [Patiria miniata]|uniref:Major facilitator superfamily (MFS) profile domain-containing protein n=1 Tax=Patiria miniata TaxID=46514 RepID=A0A913ZYU6_PATMI|nr:monocarboxylate transporter 14-like isoform X1 [Patiria miniata]
MVCPSGSRCGWWRWVVTFATFGLFVLTRGLQYSFSILFVSLQEDFHSSSALTGWLGSLSIALTCLASPLCSLLTNKLSSRTVAILGVIAFCAGLLTTSFVPVPTLGYMFFTFSILTGVGSNLATNSSLALLLDWFAKANFSRASALALMGSTAGMLAFSPLLTALITHYGWRNALRILSGGILVIGIADGLLLADPPSTDDYARAPDESPGVEKHELESMVQGKQVHDDGCIEGTDDEARETDDKTTNNEEAHISNQGSLEVGAERHFRGRLISALTNPEAWAWYLASVFSYSGWTFFNINYASLMHGLALDSNQIASVIVYFALAELGGKFLIAVIGDRLPFLYLYLLMASCLLGTVVLGLMTIAKTFGVMVLLAVVSGVLRSGVFATQFTAPAELFHEQYGTNGVMVMTLVPSGIGVLISAPLAGAIYDVTGDYVLSLLVIAALFVCALAALIFIPVRRRINQAVHVV